MKWAWLVGWRDKERARGIAGVDDGPVGDAEMNKPTFVGRPAEQEIHVFSSVELPERVTANHLLARGTTPICDTNMFPTEHALWRFFETGGDPRRLVKITGSPVLVCPRCTELWIAKYPNDEWIVEDGKAVHVGPRAAQAIAAIATTSDPELELAVAALLDRIAPEPKEE